MILNFWPDVFLAFFWNIPGCLSPQKMVGKPSNASASPELWSCDAGSTIDVTGHLGFIGNRWWMEIGNHQEITSKSAAQLRSPQTNWDTHGKLSIPLSLAWRQRFTQWISWGPLRAHAPGPPSNFIAPGLRPWCPRLDDLTNWDIAPKKSKPPNLLDSHHFPTMATCWGNFFG